MTEVVADQERNLPFLADDNEMAKRIREFDWSSTPLGPIGEWPEVLKATVRIILHTPVPIVTLWGPSGVMIYNDGYTEFAADRDPALLGSNVREGWPEVADFNDNVMKVCLAGQTLSYEDQELTLIRNGMAQQFWMNLDYSPILDENGKPVGVMAIVIETTGRVLADRRNAAEHERLQRLFEQSPSFMAMLKGENHVFEMVNPGYERLVGYRDVLGKTVAEALPEVASQGFVGMLDSAFQSGEAVTGTALPVLLQHSADQPPEQRFVDLVYQPIRDDANVVTHIFVQGSDVTERVLGERQQKLLMNELDHRVKNTLATVRAIVTRTLRGATSLADAQASLNARIMALAEAQQLLTTRKGDGADIADVVVNAIRTLHDDCERININGPALTLSPSAALALSLALHELATNATRYGALSGDTGHVDIRWTLERDEGQPGLRFAWEEKGGPTVTPPTRRGFGSTLIEEAVAAETNGTTRLDYLPAGVIFTLDAPLEAIEQS